MAVVFVGMETSGMLRRRFQALGIETYSGDFLPADDGGEEMTFAAGLPLGRHLVGDVFATLENMRANDLWPDAAIFHPTCTRMTVSASWALKDPDYDRWPGVGYHQFVMPGTPVGAERRELLQADLDGVRRIMALPIACKVIENPPGLISTVAGRAARTVQPYECGDNASKKTSIWAFDGDGKPLSLDLVPPPTLRVAGRMAEWPPGSGTMVERWPNQTDAGQNRLAELTGLRWKDRSKTYPGIADLLVSAVVKHLRAIGRL